MQRSMMQLVECVPNFSNGRDPAVIAAVRAAAAGVKGIQVLDVDPGADTNRTVLTFVGSPDAVVEAAFEVIRAAAERIDMRYQRGAHARHGATDVCPFVPVSGISMAECANLARRLGERVGRELEIPVYLYEQAASRPERQNLATVRQGEYEALPAKLEDPAWAPDFGPSGWNERVAKTGVVTIGAREFLIAYNINLNTADKRYATDIAYEIRERGRVKRTGSITPDYFRGQKLRYADAAFPCHRCEAVEATIEALSAHVDAAHDASLTAHLEQFGQDPAQLVGKVVKKPGRFAHCKAVGWVIDDYNCAQVTMNLTNYKVSPPHLVLEEVRELARARGLVVTGSELVGVIPYDALRTAGEYYLARHGGSTGLPWRDVLEFGVRSMGLSDVSPFDIDQKVLGLPEEPSEGLAALPVRAFVDEVSRNSPAPGGGSVAALAGALGGGLAAMVANLAIGQAGFEERSPALNDLAKKAQALQRRLVFHIDTDTDSYNAVLTARRLPRKTAAQKAAREAAIQEGFKEASRVPLRTAELCLEALELANLVARMGKSASLTDAGVGGLMACAGVEGAVYNVRTNLPSIDDLAFRAELGETLDTLVATARGLRDELNATVLANL